MRFIIPQKNDSSQVVQWTRDSALGFPTFTINKCEILMAIFELWSIFVIKKDYGNKQVMSFEDY